MTCDESEKNRSKKSATTELALVGLLVASLRKHWSFTDLQILLKTFVDQRPLQTKKVDLLTPFALQATASFSLHVVYCASFDWSLRTFMECDVILEVSLQPGPQVLVLHYQFLLLEALRRLPRLVK